MWQTLKPHEIVSICYIMLLPLATSQNQAEWNRSYIHAHFLLLFSIVEGDKVTINIYCRQLCQKMKCWICLLLLTCKALSLWRWAWAFTSSSSFCSLLHFALHWRTASWALVFKSSLLFVLSCSNASISLLSVCPRLWKDDWIYE